MSAQVDQRPARGIAWMREQSTTPAIVVAATGAGALLLVIVGTIMVLGIHGFTPVKNIVEGLESEELEVLLVVACVVGAISGGLGWAFLSRMPTKVSREEARAGAILGLQGLLLGGLLLWFVNGDVQKFALNYLDLEVISPQIGNLCLNLLSSECQPGFINGAKNTVFLAFSAEFFGIVLGLVLAIFAISTRAVVRAPARAYINFFRGTPLVWQLIFIGVGLPIGLGLNIPTYRAAIIALSLNAAAYAAEVFRAGIQSIERGQLEAARGLGMSYLQAMRHAVIPQAIRRVVPPLMNEFVILIKDTSLVLVLGLTAVERDLMTVGDQAVANSANATFYIMTAVGYLAITLPLIRLVNAVERRMRSGLVGIGA
jgi:His/Glu/Gln/Arg/opine family amino acid ABC transporter permease subunit